MERALGAAAAPSKAAPNTLQCAATICSLHITHVCCSLPESFSTWDLQRASFQSFIDLFCHPKNAQSTLPSSWLSCCANLTALQPPTNLGAKA